MQRKKKRVQKGARGAEQQPKLVALNKRRRQHTAQADRSRPQNEQTTRGLRVCFNARDVSK